MLSMFSASFVQEEKQKGANENVHEHSSDDAIFNKVGDWFATIGKSKEAKVSGESNA